LKPPKKFNNLQQSMRQGYPADTNGYYGENGENGYYEYYGEYGVIEDKILHFWLTLIP
jgi:hypothetical protein